ncbi:hypothetical protein INR49_004978 [Caranx melampygus]|nr:hypothetical protein INR49_004978 [Caranx melampygus]
MCVSTVVNTTGWIKGSELGAVVIFCKAESHQDVNSYTPNTLTAAQESIMDSNRQQQSRPGC